MPYKEEEDDSQMAEIAESHAVLFCHTDSTLTGILGSLRSKLKQKLLEKLNKNR